MRNVVERSAYVGIEHPLLGFVWTSQAVDFLDGVMTASAWSEPVATSLEFGFPSRFEGVFHHRLKAAIHNDGYA